MKFACAVVVLFGLFGLDVVTSQATRAPPAGYVYDEGFLLSTTVEAGNDTHIQCGFNVSIQFEPKAIHAMAIGGEDMLRVGNHPICGEGYVDTQSMAHHHTHDQGPCWCNATADGSYTCEFDMDNCLPKIEVVGDRIEYTYDIIKVPAGSNGPIQRFNCSCAQFTCSYPAEMNITSSNVAEPYIKQIIIEDAEGNGELPYDFFLADKDFNPLAKEAKVPVDDYIYGQICISGIERTDVIVQAGACWASASSDPYNMSHVYEFISPDGCRTVHQYEPEESIRVIENYECRVRFAFEAFVWSGLCIDDQLIYVHCSIKLCNDPGHSGACNHTCPSETAPESGRRRRRATDEAEDENMMTFGPVRLIGNHKVQDPCEQNNGGCDEICTPVDGLSHAICSCLPGKALATDGHSCTDVMALLGEHPLAGVQRDAMIEELERSREEEERSHRTDLLLMAMMMAAVVLLAFVLVKRNQNSKL